MIQQNSYLKVIDNSFIGEVACIRVKKNGKRPCGRTGDRFLASVKSLRKLKSSIIRSQKHLQNRGKKKALKKGDLVQGFFICGKKSVDRARGLGTGSKNQTGIKYSCPQANLAVILTANGKDFMGSRIQGPLSPALRAKSLGKAFALGGQTL